LPCHALLYTDPRLTDHNQQAGNLIHMGRRAAAFLLALLALVCLAEGELWCVRL
jgi:hypothetical protein